MKTTPSLVQLSSAALLVAVASSANAFQNFTYTYGGVQSTTGAVTAAQTTNIAGITTTLQAFANTGVRGGPDRLNNNPRFISGF